MKIKYRQGKADKFVLFTSGWSKASIIYNKN